MRRSLVKLWLYEVLDFSLMRIGTS
jgi:hypothetical protein